MTTLRGTRVLAWLTVLLLCAPPLFAEGWADERYHLSMQGPDEWVVMPPALIAQTNAQVNHLTGRGFIAGYALHETDTLVFPYMLLQFKPYSTLPEEYRPVAKLDERGQLGVIYALVKAFRQRPLPETIDTPQFIDQFGNDYARLVRLEDGRFDFTGKIPHEVGTEPIRYHTHGVIGKDGIALVSVFTVEDFSSLSYIIDNEMRTLTFAEGYSMAALPDEPPVPEPLPEPVQPEPETTEPEPVEPEPVQTPAPAAEEEPAAQAAENPGDSTALIVILSLLGAGLLAAVFIAWFITHKKAQARRERSRARRERLQASQSAAPANNGQPRPAAPAKAESRGSSGRHKSGTTRS